jgi:UPF0042 nucleotide-binding protein
VTETAQRLVIVTGMSGAGKTVVLHALEDYDYYCIDNLPAGLLTELVEHVRDRTQAAYRNIAIGIDARSPREDLDRFPQVLQALKDISLRPEVVFLSASDEALIRRFSETRRRHPLSAQGLSLAQAINTERELLAPLADQADLMIDSSQYYVYQLRDTVRERVAKKPPGGLSVQFISFGFKHGVPADADFVFDVRYLPNPHWKPKLRDLSGLDGEVVAFMESVPMVADTIAELADLLERWIPRFIRDNRSYLTIAIGCTGGHHRSVYIAERLSARIREQGCQVITTHRNL